MNFEEFASDLPLEHSLQFSSASAADSIGVSRTSSLSAIGYQKLIYIFAFLPAPDNESVSTITKYR